jgi:methylase of polypeptide subunit release factors
MEELRIPTLSALQIEDVDRRQQAQQREWAANLPAGRLVEFYGRKLAIYAGVFPPKHDTQLLARAMQIARGNCVADIGTGTGALAIRAADQGAATVLAIDICDAAVENAKENVRRANLESRVTVRKGNVFDAVPTEAAFDVVIANLPGRNKVAANEVATAHWDTEFKAHHLLFQQVGNHLAPSGRLYMVKANYPELNDAIDLACAHGLKPRIAARQKAPGDDPRTYYVLEFVQSA